MADRKGNKVYYGEYTLKHWLDLMLSKNLILPPYQRYFVWDKEKTKQLIRSLKNEEFIPPVTIGAYKNNNGEIENLIIDGQQRLTSILLAAIGYFPDRETYKKTENTHFADENDDIFLDNDETETENMIEWRFDNLIKEKTSLSNIEQSIKDSSNYKKIEEKGDAKLSESDLENCYLGFVYLVPNTNCTSDSNNPQQYYYSTVFRNINIQGETLSAQESRESLYYLRSEYSDFFHPEFIDKYTVNGRKMDFVKYLAFLSQYKSSGCRAIRLAYGFSRKIEEYYIKYIISIIREEPSGYFLSLEDIVNNGSYKDRLDSFKKNLERLNLKREYQSIIDLDTTFFGLIYYTLFQNKNIKSSEESRNELKEEIRKKVKEYKEDDKHKKTPSALVHLKKRIMDSITIYGEYIDE